MSDPRRYLDDDGADPSMREMLDAAADDDIDDAHANDLVRVIGARTGASAMASEPSRLRPGSSLALVATAVLVAAGGALVTFVETRSPSPVEPTSTSAPTRVAPSAPSSTNLTDSQPAPASDGAVSVTSLPDVTPDDSSARARTAARVAKPAASASAPAGGDLMAEIRALELVRAALTQHRAADARAALQSYDRAFPQKLLTEEARALEIETLLAEGHRDDAESLARAFLASSGDTPYARRVRTLIGAPRHP